MTYNDNTQEIINKFEPLLKELSYQEIILLNKFIVERIRLLHKAGTLISMSQFHIGDHVSWEGKDGDRHKGVVIRLNQKTVSIKIGDEGYWNVSPQFLRKED